MPKFSYVAMDPRGRETKGLLEVGSQNEAIGRVKEMGLFPTKIVEVDKEKPVKKAKAATKPAGKKKSLNLNIKIPGLSGRVKTKILTTFTRQLATLVDALVEAGRERLRPILMTTVAMIFGMLPIALATGSGAEVKNGMAWAIIGGLTSSLLLTLFIVPAVYLVAEETKLKLQKLFSTRAKKRLHAKEHPAEQPGG